MTEAISLADGEELYALFRRNLPFLVRSEDTARRLLRDPSNRVFERRDALGRLVAASVAHQNAVYLLCVDEAHRGQGLGGALLLETEAWMRDQGFARCALGAGEDYLMPGVPTNVMPCPERPMPEALRPEVTHEAWRFFQKRGYGHSWDCNCFDMRMPLRESAYAEFAPDGEIDGVRYRWATAADRLSVCLCTDDAQPSFTQYYNDEALYEPSSAQRALIAVEDGRVCGALMVGREIEGADLGSIGCTAVIHARRGRHIAANMVCLGTRFLREAGLREAFLGYTYSGLDRLYGGAGYKICTYYAMGEKAL